MTIKQYLGLLSSKENRRISLIVLTFSILAFVSGTLGFFLLSKAISAYPKEIAGLNAVEKEIDEIAILFQRQLLAWDRIVIDGRDFERSFHHWSDFREDEWNAARLFSSLKDTYPEDESLQLAHQQYKEAVYIYNTAYNEYVLIQQPAWFANILVKDVSMKVSKSLGSARASVITRVSMKIKEATYKWTLILYGSTLLMLLGAFTAMFGESVLSRILSRDREKEISGIMHYAKDHEKDYELDYGNPTVIEEYKS